MAGNFPARCSAAHLEDSKRRLGLAFRFLRQILQFFRCRLSGWWFFAIVFPLWRSGLLWAWLVPAAILGEGGTGGLTRPPLPMANEDLGQFETAVRQFFGIPVIDKSHAFFAQFRGKKLPGLFRNLPCIERCTLGSRRRRTIPSVGTFRTFVPIWSGPAVVLTLLPALFPLWRAIFGTIPGPFAFGPFFCRLRL